MSPCLFNLLIADLEEMRWGVGGVRLKGEEVYSLAYADDVILLAEEEDMRAMMARLERYEGEGAGDECGEVKNNEVYFYNSLLN